MAKQYRWDCRPQGDHKGLCWRMTLRMQEGEMVRRPQQGDHKGQYNSNKSNRPGLSTCIYRQFSLFELY